MKKALNSSEPWWVVVQSMAELVAFGYDELELIENSVSEELEGRGFTKSEVQKAVAWVEKAINSGTINECLAMLQKQGSGVRVDNPIEKLCFSPSVWTSLETCRQKGLLSDEAVERVLEGARVIDTRDWDDDEVSKLLAEILSGYNPNTSEADYLDMLQRCLPSFYC